MTKSNKCDCCGRKATRPCLALQGPICSACCGSQRGSQLQCPAECHYFPFGLYAYDSWLKIDINCSKKIVDFVLEHKGRDCVHNTLEHMVAREPKNEDEMSMAMELAYSHLIYFEKDPEGRRLVDLWQDKEWQGLNNDEKIMVHHRQHMFPTVIEIQKIYDHQAMECMDCFDKNPVPFVVFDRSTVSRGVPRFTKVLTWITHFPYFSRIGGGGVEIPYDLWPDFKNLVEFQFLEDKEENPSLSIQEFFRQNFADCCQLVWDIASERRQRMLESIDVHQCTACYEVVGDPEKIIEILDKKPDFRLLDDKDLEDGDPDETLYYDWLRAGASKKLEDAMPSAFRHDAKNQGVGVLGNLKFTYNEVTVEAFSKQKFEFAKEMVKRYFKKLLSLRAEKVVDIAKQMIDKEDSLGSEFTDEEIYEKNQANTIPKEIEQELMSNYFLNHYKNFLDESIPMLDQKTPRECANNPEMRSKLVELIKNHMHNVEKMSRGKGIDLSIDWIADELGLRELMR